MSFEESTIALKRTAPDCFDGERHHKSPVAGSRIARPVGTSTWLIDGRRFMIGLLTLAFALVVSMCLPGSRAEAACSVPNQLANGQVADANAVMGDFNALKNCADSAVAPSGSPAAGNLPVFSGSNTITGGNLSGDCTTAGTLAVTCTRSNGVTLGYFATGTDAGQLTGTVSVNRFNNGTNADGAHFLRGDGIWATVSNGGGGTTGGTPSVRAANIQSSSSGSYTVTWPAGTVAGDVVIIFADHAWSLNNPAGWTVFDNEVGSSANGMVIGKVMTAADISAGSVTITTGGVYNGVLAAVTINGSTMTGLRGPAVFVRSGGGPAAGARLVLSSFIPLPTDLVLVFVGIRAATNITLSSGLTSIASVNAADASGNLARFTGSLELLGLSETATPSAAGSGYYTAILFLR
jgi:hypothetical protein